MDLSGEFNHKQPSELKYEVSSMKYEFQPSAFILQPSAHFSSGYGLTTGIQFALISRFKCMIGVSN